MEKNQAYSREWLRGLTDRLLKATWLTVSAAAVLIWSAWPGSIGQASIIVSDTHQTFDIDFNDFEAPEDTWAQPGAPNAGQLDSNTWAFNSTSDSGAATFGGTHSGGQGETSGSTTTPGVYAFDVSGDVAWGVVGGVVGDDNFFTPGNFTARLENSTEVTIDEITIEWDVWWRSNGDGISELGFAYSFDNDTYTDAGEDFKVQTQNTASDWQQSSRLSLTLSDITIPDGGTFYLRWIGNDVQAPSPTFPASNSRDQMGIANISITAVPEPSAFILGGLMFGIAWVSGGIRGRRRRAA